MPILNKVNVLRRTIMHKATQHIGSSNKLINENCNEKIDVKRVLICRPNQRLGNLLLLTPLVQEIVNTFPDCKIDVFVKGGLAPIIFKNYPAVNTIIELPRKPFKELFKYSKVWLRLRKEQYDIAINIDKNSSSGRLSTKFANARFKFFGDNKEFILSKNKDAKHFAKRPVYNFRDNLAQLGWIASSQIIPSLDLKLSADEIENGKKILDSIADSSRKTICLFTYATGSKRYSETWWASFYEKLKSDYPNYNYIEILPIENVSQIQFKIPYFYSKDIREIGSVIANTAVFIGADSGIMHLSSAVLTPTIGLFSVTNPEKYKPYNNNSFALNTNYLNNENFKKALNKILLTN